MKVLIISTEVLPTPPYPRYGGIEWITFWLAKALHELGHTVGLVGVEGTFASHKEIEVFPILSKEESGGGIVMAERIGKVLDYFQPDIVNDHSHSKACFQEIEKRKIPYVPSSHTIAIPDLKVPKPCWTALSQSHARWLEKRYGVKCEVCYNGIEYPEKPITRWVAKVSPPIALGRPNPEKGLLDVIEFCKKHDIPLNVIAGRLEYEQIGYAFLVAQECKIFSKWTYHGEVSHERKMQMLSQSKCLLNFPAWPEPFGLVVPEANWVGTPAIALDMGCYTPDTRVMTPTGLKEYHECKIGDLVYSLNPITKKIELKPITKIFEYDFCGNLINIETRDVSLLITPNHNLLIEKNDNLSFEKAENIVNFSSFKIPTAGVWQGEALDLNKIIPHTDIYRNGNKISIPKIQPDDFMELCGWYLSEGVIGFARNNCVNKTKISFCVPSTDKYRPDLIKILDRMGLHHADGENVIDIFSRELANFFSLFGTGAESKFIPDFIKSLDATYLRSLWYGIMKGDGWMQSGSFYGIETSSKKLAEDLVDIGIKLGMTVKLRIREPRKGGEIKGRVIMSNKIYRVLFSKKRTTKVSRDRITQKFYKGKVWCFEVADNHNLLVERNGKFVFCGNSMREIIEDGKTGYVIPVKRDESGEPVMEYNIWGFPKPVFDEQKVLDALHNIESLDLEYVAKYVREKFSIKKMGEGYLRVYEKVLNGERW